MLIRWLGFHVKFAVLFFASQHLALGQTNTPAPGAAPQTKTPAPANDSVDIENEATNAELDDAESGLAPTVWQKITFGFLGGTSAIVLTSLLTESGNPDEKKDYSQKVTVPVAMVAGVYGTATAIYYTGAYLKDQGSFNAAAKGAWVGFFPALLIAGLMTKGFEKNMTPVPRAWHLLAALPISIISTYAYNDSTFQFDEEQSRIEIEPLIELGTEFKAGYSVGFRF